MFILIVRVPELSHQFHLLIRTLKHPNWWSQRLPDLRLWTIALVIRCSRSAFAIQFLGAITLNQLSPRFGRLSRRHCVDTRDLYLVRSGCCYNGLHKNMKQNNNIDSCDDTAQRCHINAGRRCCTTGVSVEPRVEIGQCYVPRLPEPAIMVNDETALRLIPNRLVQL